MRDERTTYVTKTGRVLTDDYIEALAEEAEHGYHVDEPLAHQLCGSRAVVQAPRFLVGVARGDSFSGFDARLRRSDRPASVIWPTQLRSGATRGTLPGPTTACGDGREGGCGDGGSPGSGRGICVRALR